MTPLVVIELPDAPVEQRAQVVDSCNLALRKGACDVAQAKKPESGCSATVRWRADDLSAVVEFRSTREQAQLVEVRRVEFTNRDSSAARAEALGVLVASLVGDHDCRISSASPSPTVMAPARPKPPVVGHRSGAELHAAASALAGVGNGGPRWGGELGILGGLERSPWRLAASAGYSVAEHGSLRLDRWTGAAGVGFSPASGTTPMGVELRAEAVAQLLRASSPEAIAAPRALSKVRLGGRVLSSLLLALDNRWALSLGAELQWLTPDVAVTVNGREGAFQPRFESGLQAGVRVSL